MTNYDIIYLKSYPTHQLKIRLPMDTNYLIPTPDKIPVQPWIMILLEQSTFIIHIFIINALVGGALLIIFNRWTGIDIPENGRIGSRLSKSMPVLAALGINFGVAPLLFMQVIYGHLFYTGSVLMAFFWILVIPVLIAAYYALHFHFKKTEPGFRGLRTSLIFAVVLLLYVAFMQVSNNSLLERPETWSAYFNNRSGFLLNISFPIFIPRLLHFIFASVSIGALFNAVINAMGKKRGESNSDNAIKASLKIFGISSIAQAISGLCYLVAIPKEFILEFMGRDAVSTIVLLTGALCAVGAIISGFKNRLSWTIIFAGITMVLMIASRYELRTMYLSDNFRVADLQVAPQYGVFFLFLGILIIGFFAIYYMLKISSRPSIDKGDNL
jgi:hypothetical protein